MRRLKLTCIIGFLILLDQGIKLYIKANLLNRHLNILGDFVQFKPKFNNKYSWINSLFDLGISRTIHIIFVVLLLIIISLGFKFVTAKYVKNRVIDGLFVLIISGAVCSLSDKLFWGGSLDYIRLKGLFTFDLKDVYISMFELLILVLLIINYRGIRELSNAKLINDFKQFVKGTRN